MLEFMSVTKALADENRVRILAALQDRELCVCQIVELLQLAPSTVSKHVSILKQAHLVEGRKDGRWMYYRHAAEDAPRAATDALSWVETSTRKSRQIREDARRLKEILRIPPGGAMPPALPKLSILFLCTGNSCRSQMAEGWARALRGDRIEAFSAGVEAQGLNPRAVAVMAEAGVDISGHRSKHVDELKDRNFDLVITVCDSARESCPVLAGAAHTVHRSFDDPPLLAMGAGSEEEALAPYRRVRDEIRAFVEMLPGCITGNQEPRDG